MPAIPSPSGPHAARGAAHEAPAVPHPLVEAASRGVLPDWAVAGPERRAHMERVAELLDGWAAGLGLGGAERIRWRAAGHLHDALRDERGEALRPQVPESHRLLPGGLLHGPAVAERLRAAGVDDHELLAAISFHTLGDASLGPLGRALYAADFLEPGRSFLEEWRAARRERMPGDFDAVVIEIARARIENLLARGTAVLPQTTAFWNSLVEERR